MSRDRSAPGQRGLPDPADLDEDEAEYGDKAGLPRAERRKDASMTLLTSMLERPLDPGYQAMAEAREARGEPRSTGPRRPLLLISLLLIGLLIGISTANLRAREGVRSQTRADLIEQIQSRQAAVDEGGEEARRLQREIDAAGSKIPPGELEARQQDQEALRVTTGVVAVEGPGVTITVDDADGTGDSADGDPRTGGSDEGRVQSGDLQVITNGLWAAGAEAIAVNDQRLTAHSAIRFAGEAILVNFRPLTRPYTIEAVGDPEELRSGFEEGPGGAYLDMLGSDYDIPTSVSTDDTMTLPGADEVSSVHAEVVSPGEDMPPERPVEEESR